MAAVLKNPARQPVNLRELYIDFAGAQITVRTDSPDVERLVRQAYRMMLVDDARLVLKVVEIRQSDNGFSLSALVEEESMGTPDYVLRWLKPRILSTFIDYRKDLIWLHSAVVRRANAATLLVGPSGSGKSTLATLLCQTGWAFLSDEVAPISFERDCVHPYPQTPSRREHPSARVSSEDVRALPRIEWNPPGNAVARRETPFDKVVLLHFSFNSATIIRRLKPGEASLMLLRNVMNFGRHQNEAVSRLVRVAESIPCYLVEYGDAADASSIISNL